MTYFTLFAHSLSLFRSLSLSPSLSLSLSAFPLLFYARTVQVQRLIFCPSINITQGCGAVSILIHSSDCFHREGKQKSCVFECSVGATHARRPQLSSGSQPKGARA